MKKNRKVKAGGILFFFVLLFVFIIPIIINELYKNNGGYITLWGAADALAYYGAILQAVFSMVALFITILYTRKQIKYEHIEHIENGEIRNIKLEFSNFIEVLYPLKLFKIKLLYGDKKEYYDKILEEFLLYQVDLKLVCNKMKCLMNLEQHSYMMEFLNDLLEFADILIEHTDDLYMCYDKLRIANSEEVKNGIYIDIEKICEKLQVLTNSDYQKILAVRKEVYFQLEKDLESDLSQIINI